MSRLGIHLRPRLPLAAGAGPAVQCGASHRSCRGRPTTKHTADHRKPRAVWGWTWPARWSRPSNHVSSRRRAMNPTTSTVTARPTSRPTLRRDPGRVIASASTGDGAGSAWLLSRSGGSSFAAPTTSASTPARARRRRGCAIPPAAIQAPHPAQVTASSTTAQERPDRLGVHTRTSVDPAPPFRRTRHGDVTGSRSARPRRSQSTIPRRPRHGSHHGTPVASHPVGSQDG